MPFLNQQNEENDRRKYLIINLHERILPRPAGIEPAISWSPVDRASDWATEAGSKRKNKQNMKSVHMPQAKGKQNNQPLFTNKVTTKQDRIHETHQ